MVGGYPILNHYGILLFERYHVKLLPKFQEYDLKYDEKKFEMITLNSILILKSFNLLTKYSFSRSMYEITHRCGHPS